jgi:hypothetical protein
MNSHIALRLSCNTLITSTSPSLSNSAIGKSITFDIPFGYAYAAPFFYLSLKLPDIDVFNY